MPTTSFPPEFSAELDGVVQRYIEAAQRQREFMLGMKMEMEIDGRFTKLRERGTMRVLRTITKLGVLTVDVLGYSGDNRIKTQLISRYLEEEEKAKAYGVMTITPEEYEFKISAILRQSDRATYVFALRPWKKGPGKFRGELWVDGATGMPLREAGRFVKSPNIVLTNIRFARDYELRDGISVVTHVHSSTDVRLLGVGSAELDINFSNFSRVTEEQPAREERL